MASLPNPSPVQASPSVLALLERLHIQSRDQENAIEASEIESQGFDNVMRDKFIALDKDKCEFVYQLCRTIDAKNIVEAGTSFGVSTIYLALAVASNIAAAAATANGDSTATSGVVIGTENEPSKAEVARKHWSQLGSEISQYIDLREGDLRETLKKDLPEIDLLLLDIWTPMALPVLKLVQPKMRRGAVVIADNTIGAATGYKDLLEYLRAPGSGFLNTTLPFHRGLEMSVYLP